MDLPQIALQALFQPGKLIPIRIEADTKQSDRQRRRHSYAIPKSFCICSSDLPLVSGITRQIKISCKSIITAKKINDQKPPCLFTSPFDNSRIEGTTVVMIAAITQCVVLPSEPPL